jgi:hypothetical protein
MKRFSAVWLLFMVFSMVVVCGCGGGGGSTATTNNSIPALSENFTSFGIGDVFTSSSWADAWGGAFPTWHVQEAGKALYMNTAGSIVYIDGGSSSWANYTFTFRFKVDNLAVVACAFVRFIGGSENSLSYYQINIQDGNLMTLSKNPSDAAASYVPASTAISYVANTYYSVRVAVNGSNIKVYFDTAATPNIDFTDDGATYGASQPAGTIGVGSPSGLVYFDDLAVTPL